MGSCNGKSSCDHDIFEIGGTAVTGNKRDFSVGLPRFSVGRLTCEVPISTYGCLSPKSAHQSPQG